MYVVTARSMATLSDTTDRFIPDNGQWVTATKAVTYPTYYPGSTRKVMSVSIDIDHPRKGHLDIDIIDPKGEVYVFREPNPNDGGAWKLPGSTYTFYQTGSHTESPFYENDFMAGNYQLRIRDTVAGYSGTLRNWRIYFF
jgi:subtilisin-like proprotein convertase family protein